MHLINDLFNQSIIYILTMFQSLSFAARVMSVYKYLEISAHKILLYIKITREIEDNQNQRRENIALDLILCNI